MLPTSAPTCQPLSRPFAAWTGRRSAARSARVHGTGHAAAGRFGTLLVFVALIAFMAGCHAVDFRDSALQQPPPVEMEPPSELNMVSLPTYRIEPPDVIRIEATTLIPKQPYRIGANDVLMIRAYGAPRGLPLDNYYGVNEQGIVDLGPAYGVVFVGGLTVPEANATVRFIVQQLAPIADVSVQLARSADAVQLTSEYPVQSDGTIILGRYGTVTVAGKSVSEARQALLNHLDQYFESIQLGVDVIGFNSEGYYVIVAGSNSGEKVQRFPMTGNDTVLDAIANLQGLSRVSSKSMWVARATPGGTDAEEILPVDWDAIARGGVATSNYQLLPGDRLFIVDDNLVAANDFINRATMPIERLLSISSLGADTIRGLQVLGRTYNRSRGY